VSLPTEAECTVPADLDRTPPLTITCGSDPPYTALPADGPVTLGRELPAQIRVHDPRISRTHVRVEPGAAGWRLIDLDSTNGTFLEGQRISAVAITDGMAIQLGHPVGVVVWFGLGGAANSRAPKPTTAVSQPVPARSTPDHSDDETVEITDPAIARVGAAVAARREELGYSQRRLSDDKVISQSNLVAFERGRSWPREGTRAKLERYLQWPPGTLARLRQGAAVPQAEVGESTEALSDTVQVSMLVDAVQLALDGIKARAAGLAAPDDPGFNVQIGQLLADLRRLQTTTANAARSATGPAVALLLSDVRRTYHELMLRAARAPGASLGARLFAARRAAELTIDEAAAAAGVNPAAVADAEADQAVPVGAAAALEALIAQLGYR
jgi:transcriptional regulator with XRE-family HTH domain